MVYTNEYREEKTIKKGLFMRMRGRLLCCIAFFGFSFSANGFTELELQKLEKYSFTASLPTQTLNKVFVDLSVVRSPRSKLKPLSIREFRSSIKKRLALQLNPKWQIGVDSFKACPLDEQLIDWPEATKPKESRTPSQRGYGLGIRMRLD